MMVVALLAPGPARAANDESPLEISYDDALVRAARVAPDVVVARGREAVANAEIGIAGTYPNPTVLGATSTQAAKFSGDVLVPLIVLGQRGAAERASRADYETVRVDTKATLNDVRSSCAHAFVVLWLAQRNAEARADAAAVARRLEGAVLGRVDVGSAPAVEGLRVRAERLRADADAREAEQLVDAAASELGRWIGVIDGRALRAKGEPTTPEAPPALGALALRVNDNPAARREDFDALASEAHASRERALVRPAMTLNLGMDVADPTLPATNYRAQLGIEVPLFNQRGAYVEREQMGAAVARARADAQRRRLTADLVSAYRTFEAVSARRKALEEGVLPAAEAAANATEESYALGHAPLVTVLDAERARIDARISLIEARAARASAWIDVMQAAGWP
jgi:cobalt-zinc-cadmium efflux system outer membrane protein